MTKPSLHFTAVLISVPAEPFFDKQIPRASAASTHTCKSSQSGCFPSPAVIYILGLSAAPRLSTGGLGRSRRVKLEILMMAFRLRLPQRHGLCVIGRPSGILRTQLPVMSLTNASACCGGSQTHPPFGSKSKQQVFFFRKTFFKNSTFCFI